MEKSRPSFGATPPSFMHGCRLQCVGDPDVETLWAPSRGFLHDCLGSRNIPGTHYLYTVAMVGRLESRSKRTYFHGSFRIDQSRSRPLKQRQHTVAGVTSAVKAMTEAHSRFDAHSPARALLMRSSWFGLLRAVVDSLCGQMEGRRHDERCFFRPP
jgi:hypothetical protein